MKSKSALQALLFSSTLLAAQSAHAQLTWDANGTGTGQTNGGGDWLNPNLWWNGTANQNWVSAPMRSSAVQAQPPLSSSWTCR